MTTSPLQPLTTYHEMFSFDIGIIPLTDIPFNRAKSCLKGLEYSCAGVPFIAQGLPEYERLNALGVGRIANSPDEWRAHMAALLDYNTRKRDARINRENVIHDHTIMQRESEWRAIVAELSGESVAA